MLAHSIYKAWNKVTQITTLYGDNDVNDRTMAMQVIDTYTHSHARYIAVELMSQPQVVGVRSEISRMSLPGRSEAETTRVP